MRTACEWLEILLAHDGDVSVLADYEADLLAAISVSVRRDSEFHCAAELLLRTFPYFALVRVGNTQAWSRLLSDALVELLMLRDNELLAQVLRWIGEQDIAQGKRVGAQRAFESMLARAQDGDTDEMIVAAYIGLSKLQWFEVNAEMTTHLAEQALAAAKGVTDTALKGDLHDALARAYISVADTKRAIGHAQTAILYWMPQDDPAELGRVAFTLAIAYRNAALKHNAPAGLMQADFFLEFAGERVAGSEYAWQYALLAYERGSLCHQRGDYEAAVQWYGNAFDEARQLNRLPIMAISQHGLGLALTELGNFEEARARLKAAFAHWQELGKHFEQASVMQALGHLENLAGDKRAARLHLLRARKMCSRLPPNQQRDILGRLIDDTLDEL